MGLAIVPVVEFLEYLTKSSDPYNYSDCDVVSVTHSKNNDSWVKHEYLHLIIRHRPSEKWRRILVERQRPQDQVIIGYWPWVAQGGVADDNDVSLAPGDPKVPSPLLMRNISGFEPLGLQAVASVLLEVHRQHPVYHLLAENCYWYSDAVFQILKAMVKGATYREWSWIRLVRVFAFFSPFTKLAAREDALKFKTQLRSEQASVGDALFGVGAHLLEMVGIKVSQDQVEEVGASEDFQSKIAGIYDVSPSDTLGADSDPSVSASGREALLHENKVAERMLLAMKEVDAISHLEASCRPSAPAIRSATEERKESINAFSASVLANPQKEANLAFLENCLNSSIKEVVRDEPDPYIIKLAAAAAEIGSANAPSEEEEARYDEAVRAFAGGVLIKLREDGISF